MKYLSPANGFSYDEYPPLTAYPLATFLFLNKLGYCQQFAGSMALLLRMGGVPARVATGFTTGAYDQNTKSWFVTDVDAHAWVEAWFPHYGWVTFDPTPAAAPARGGHAPISSLGTLNSANALLQKARHVDTLGGPTAGGTITHRGGSSSIVLLVALGVRRGAARARVRRLAPDRAARSGRDAGRARAGAGPQRTPAVRRRDAGGRRAAVPRLARRGDVRARCSDSRASPAAPRCPRSGSGALCADSCARGSVSAARCARCGRCRRVRSGAEGVPLAARAP